MNELRMDANGVVVTCDACRRENRLTFGSLGKPVRCGQCKSPLPPPSVPIAITDSGVFEAAAANSAWPLIVDFWAPWCGPCRMVAPEMEKIARDTAGRYLVVKVNTDELTDVARRFRIQSIPTLAVVFGGREIDRLSGARPAADILRFVEQALAA